MMNPTVVVSYSVRGPFADLTNECNRMRSGKLIKGRGVYQPPFLILKGNTKNDKKRRVEKDES